MSRLTITLMRALAPLPLPVLRVLGVLLGWFLYFFAARRRRVTEINLAMCFPAVPVAARRALARHTFIRFAQAWLDRSWLWHGSIDQLEDRLVLSGAVEQLDGSEPTVLFAPHFVGLDAGWTALALHVPRRLVTIYTDQANKTMDQWILAGRQRRGMVLLFGRADGVKPVLSALRQGALLYLLPDMNFGPDELLFVPFYGVSAATLPSLSRFARLGGQGGRPAKVVPVLTRLTRQGYRVQILDPWRDFPSSDVMADTLRMNRELEAYIDMMPGQYYWVHRRFKDRPEGEPPVY